MKDTLVIVIVVNDGTTTKQYLERMGFSKLGRPGGENAAFINEESFAFVTDGVETRAVDVILLPDADLDKQQIGVLRGQADLKKNVYVAYHQGSELTEHQQEKFAEIFGEKLVSFPLYEPHDSGNVFNALKELAQCNGNSDKQQYQNALGRLIELFPYNLDLDARLELLHLCLTREGAALIVKEKLPGHIPSSVRHKISELIKIQTDGRTIEDIIRELAAPSADPFDETEGRYIKKLETIRKVLLPESNPTGESPE